LEFDAMNDHVWCIRHGAKRGFWLRREICIATQSNPDKKCPAKCHEREGKNDNRKDRAVEKVTDKAVAGNK